MIGGTGNTRIFLCTQDTDMRKSFDGLRGIIRSAMHLDPLSGGLFLFKNKRGERIEVVYWDSDGFALWYKVLRATCKGARMNGIKFPRDPPSLSSRRAVIDRVRGLVSNEHRVSRTRKATT